MSTWKKVDAMEENLVALLFSSIIFLGISLLMLIFSGYIGFTYLDFDRGFSGNVHELCGMVISVCVSIMMLGLFHTTSIIGWARKFGYEVQVKRLNGSTCFGKVEGMAYTILLTLWFVFGQSHFPEIGYWGGVLAVVSTGIYFVMLSLAWGLPSVKEAHRYIKVS